MTQRDEPEEARNREREPRKIEANIEETRAAISEHLEAISDKLTPEHIKHEAKEAAVHAKDKAVSKIRNAKDSAVESLSERAHEVGRRAGRAGNVSFDYARQNALPLSLIGLGLGWLVMSSRKRAQPELEVEVEGYRTGPEYFGPGQAELGGTAFPAYGSIEEEEEDATLGARERPFGEQEKLDFGERAGGRLEHERERLHRVKSGARERASRFSTRTKDRARDIKQRARGGIERRREQASGFAHRNPLALGAVALAAGIGVGMLLPETRREKRLLGGRRDRFLGEAKSTMSEVRRAVSDTTRDVKSSVTSTEGR